MLVTRTEALQSLKQLILALKSSKLISDDTLRQLVEAAKELSEEQLQTSTRSEIKSLLNKAIEIIIHSALIISKEELINNLLSHSSKLYFQAEISEPSLNSLLRNRSYDILQVVLER